MTNHAAEPSALSYARVAGLAYLLIIVLSILYAGFVESKLIVSGNDAATSNNIIANDILFRIGIVGVLVIYASVVVLSMALYVVLRTVNKNLALLAMLFRLGEAIVGAATVLISFIVLHLLDGNHHSVVFETDQLQALVGLFLNVRTAGLDIVLIFVGLGGTVFCYLFFVSRYIPRILSVWGIFTYLSMLTLSLVSILLPNHPASLEIVLYAMGTFFELAIGFWLLFKGVDLQQWANHAPAPPAIQPMSQG